MKRVAIFGNAGGGKSTLARDLSRLAGLPLHVLDKMQFRAGGAAVPYDEYLQAHASLIAGEHWIIDGYGCNRTVWERLDAADTLIHVDLPLVVHGLWVTKRLVQGFVRPPLGWPEGSPLLSSTISSYRVLWPCHTRLTPRYRQYVTDAAQHKRVHSLHSGREIKQFLATVRHEIASARPSRAPA